MVRAQRFGNQDTQKKQGVVVNYLKSYLRVMSKKDFHLTYVDAFAGCGARIDAAKHETKQQSFLIENKPALPKIGTALEAVQLDPGFDRCVFGDLNEKHLQALRERVLALKHGRLVLPEIEIMRMDANDLVRKECAWIAGDKNRRAVMFLDPYGMQVEWRSLQEISRCPGIDLWLLLPTGMAVSRMMPRRKVQNPKWGEKLDLFYGSTEWRGEFYRQKVGLWGDLERERLSNLQDIVDFSMKRLESIFGNGLYRLPLTLKTDRKITSYHLVFATSSKSDKAIEISHRIAGHLVSKAHSGT